MFEAVCIVSALDVEWLRRELTALCETVRDALSAEGHIIYSAGDNTLSHCSSVLAPALACVSKTLFETLGFRGNVQDYYDPKNRRAMCCIDGDSVSE